MNRLILAGLTAALFCQPASAQGFGDFLRGILGGSTPEKTTSETAPTKSTSPTLGSVLGQSDAEAGLKEALVIGTRAVSAQLSAKDGYFGDSAIHIPLPGRLGDIQKQLSKFGMSGPLDELELKMNRAAEEAAPYAADVVVNAVKSLTIDDAIALVKGGDTSATDLLRTKTEDQLTVLLRPRVEDALQNTGALTQLDNVANKYGMSELGTSARNDLVDHAVAEALDGLFFYLAKEEQGIRNDPVQRTTDLLRRVFGG